MPAISFARLKDELRLLYTAPLRSKATWEKLRQVFSELEQIGVKRSSDLNAPTIAKWIAAHPRRTPITCHSLLRSMRAIATYASKSGYLKADPFDWRSPAEWLSLAPEDIEPEDAFDRHLTATEVLKILILADRDAATGNWQSGRLQALIYMFAFTGMRKMEVLGMPLADLDIARRTIKIRANRRRKLKTRGAAAPLAIAEPLAEVLELWVSRTGCEWLFPGLKLQGPWLYGGPGYRALDQVRDLGDRAGIKGLTMLSFRHTFATLAEGWLMGELELQRWLRHKRRRTQDSYRRHGDVAAIRATASKISFKAS